MRRRALVSQTRMPEHDRDRGSQRVDALIRWLLDDGWSVTFLAEEDAADPAHARRLRQLGVATFAGYGDARAVVAAGGFDLAILAFWQPASRLLPLLRAESPDTRIIVDTIDVHFLREARRRFGINGEVDQEFGDLLVQELNTYRAADAVLAVSTKEAELLGDLLGSDRVLPLALAEELTRSAVPFEERRGMFFVGNFRHLPNGEAVEFLCRDVIPRLDPALLSEHPLTVVGNRLDGKVRANAAGLRNVHMVGWVPSIIPYFEHARVSVVPLLHGAGVKGKVIQALMLGTPVVTTPIGAEGLDLEHGRHALISETPEDLAAAITRTLTDATAWQRLADAGSAHARATYDSDAVRDRFRSIVEDVLDRPAVAPADSFRHGRRRAVAYRDTTTAVLDAVRTATDPGSIVLVVSKGDDDLLGFDGRTAWHFPQANDGRWAGYHPADSASALRHLEALTRRGARYLALPSSSFWWLHHYGELAEHLESTASRVHSDEHLVLFDLAPPPRYTAAPPVPDGAERPRVLVRGTYAARRPGPPPALVAELGKTRRFALTQEWSANGNEDPGSDSPTPDADWLVFVDDTAILPSGFLDDFLSLQTELGVDRAQPAHTSGPTAGPPITERLRGCVGREVQQRTPLPVFATRSGATLDGPVTLIDEIPVALAQPLAPCGEPGPVPRVSDVFVRTPDGITRGVRRSTAPEAAAISALVTTFERPDLLAGCLEAFCEQTLDPGTYEVVVVDDGSADSATVGVLEQYAGRLPLVWLSIDHAGRSAAKNVAVLLARADLVLFFDDDDRPAPDLLEEHVRGHDAHPDEGVAILGYTDWAPELTVTPLMRYVTDVDKLLFAYGNLEDGQELDWRGFWEGRISCKRSLLVRHALHDQRLAYSIDVEMGRRLAPHGLRVVYRRAAQSHMARSIDFDGFCRRIEAKGRAQALMALLHAGDDEVRKYTKVDEAAERWERARHTISATSARVRELEFAGVGVDDIEDPRVAELHRSYREVFMAHNAKGVVDAFRDDGSPPPASTPAPAAPATAPTPTSATEPVPLPSRAGAGAGAPRPQLTVTIPVWSRTAELADMAVGTVERVWEVARIPTEVIVVDNGSPHERSLPAIVHRYDENRGVATGWNTGIEMASAPVVAVLNSDCLVEPGWDEALYEAATAGRRIGFPYTDHGDGLGFRQPDQAGTSGWCFMLTRDVFREIGPFDERFNPAYCEDTDYWHRAWQLGIELSPVPAAHVTHARRTTAQTDPHYEWLLQGHRYKYGWKHGVDPLRAPPYYNRPIVEYVTRDHAPAPT